MLKTSRNRSAKCLLNKLTQNVSTWSTPLATAFNSPPYNKINITRNESVSS